MRRKWIIAGIFLGLAVAVVVVVLLTQQPVNRAVAQTGFTLTTNGQIIVQPRSGYGVMTVVADLPKTNSAGTVSAPQK